MIKMFNLNVFLYFCISFDFVLKTNLLILFSNGTTTSQQQRNLILDQNGDKNKLNSLLELSFKIN